MRDRGQLRPELLLSCSLTQKHVELLKMDAKNVVNCTSLTAESRSCRATCQQKPAHLGPQEGSGRVQTRRTGPGRMEELLLVCRSALRFGSVCHAAASSAPHPATDADTANEPFGGDGTCSQRDSGGSVTPGAPEKRPDCADKVSPHSPSSGSSDTLAAERRLYLRLLLPPCN